MRDSQYKLYVEFAAFYALCFILLVFLLRYPTLIEEYKA